MKKKKLIEQKNQNEKKIIDLNNSLFQSTNGLFSGDVNSQNVIVEFFDYNCSYCKEVHKELKKILKKGDSKIIYKNFPILSERSVELAKISILVGKEDNLKFNKFHEFLLKNKNPSNKQIETFFLANDLNYNQIVEQIDGEYVTKNLEADIKLAQDLSLRGTPAFIINNEIHFGYFSMSEIESKLFNQQ